MSLRTEIFEQTEVMRRLLSEGWPHIQRVARSIKRKGFRYIFLAARGTSDNAGLYAKYLLGSHNRIPLAQAAPSLFSLYDTPPNLRAALVVAISQSGQSPDIVQVVEEGRRQSVPTLAITNDIDSPLGQAAEHVIDILAGDEKAVAATKTYTAQLMAVALLSCALLDDSIKMQSLNEVPGKMQEALDQEGQAEKAAQRFAKKERCVVIGRGFNYATAFEWALKIKELAYTVAEPYSSADFLHGPIAIVEPDFPVLIVAPDGAVYPQLLELAGQLHAEHETETTIISNNREIMAHSQAPIRVPQTAEWISPLISILPAQLFSFHLASLRGLDTEQPRGLNKVTRTH
jgi:glucosamine--fructose-6-phosphate aminotransferase (isomerizing)